MARIRTVKPDLFGSFTLATVAIEARYLFVGLFTEADDDGRLIDSPKRLAGAIFPHDERVAPKHVDAWLADLEKVGCIVRYEVSGGRYIAFPEWSSHQRISHPTPSKLPNPSGEVPETLRPEWEGEREQGKGTGKPSGLKTPLTPSDDGGSDASPPKNSRAHGTNPRAVAKAQEPEKARARALRMATDLGRRRFKDGTFGDPNDVADEARSKYQGDEVLIAAAIEGFIEAKHSGEVTA